MRILLYIGILAALLAAPVTPADISHLLPVEAVALSCDGETVILETDTENRGQGSSAPEALADLKENTPAVVYLDTARYLFVTSDAVEYIRELEPYLKRRIEVCMWSGEGELRTAVRYIKAHREMPK